MENDINQIRRETTQAFLRYQTLKYNLDGIIPIQNEYHSLSFQKYCFIGKIKLEEEIYVCDAILPNFEVKNVKLEVRRNKGEWEVILKVNFFGLSLCVNHTKNNHLYFVGEPNNFNPSFKIIAKEIDLLDRIRDNMI